MNDKKFAFIFCTNDAAWEEECTLYLQHLHVPVGYEMEILPIQGASSMCAGYNRAQGLTDARYKVYLHQDVLMANKDVMRDLLEIFADASIGTVGVIGCKCLPKTGVWWDGFRTYGRVLHACEPESIVDSVNQQPEDGVLEEVEAVDGLFIATQYDIPWREDLFDGWHFYDTSSCMEMRRAGYRVVVPNQEEYFWCIHCPKEKPIAVEYKDYQKIFLKEYGAELHPEI